jgi:hypothetical protein
LNVYTVVATKFKRVASFVVPELCGAGHIQT